MYNMMNKINTAVCYIWNLLGEQILRVLITRKNFFFFFLSLYERMDVHESYCGNHFMVYVSQVIILCT